jgi:hypothetical protein
LTRDVIACPSIGQFFHKSHDQGGIFQKPIFKVVSLI